MKKTSMRVILLLLVVGCLGILFIWFQNQSDVKESASVMKVEGAVHVSKQVEASCMGCHAVDENGKLARIEYMRKTPEGWSQTIARMERIHGLKLTDEQRRQLIQDLSAERGLAPEEAEAVQYWTANKPSYTESVKNENVQNACMTCHAGGRFMAQRRTEEEWKNLKDFHLVMLPSIYLNHRHMDWPVVADAAIRYLAEQYPLETEEWRQWKGKGYDVQGKWKVVGFRGTKGTYIGDSEFVKDKDGFVETKTIRYLHEPGSLTMRGQARLYTGYALRTQYQQDKKKLTGTFNVLEGGTVIKGDWSDASDPGITGEEMYYKVQTEKPEIIHMEPQAIERGKTQDITLYGMNLQQLTAKDMRLPAGVSVQKITPVSNEEIKVTVAVGKNVAEGSFAIGSGQVISHKKLAVYHRVDYVKVTPSYAVSRVGGAGPMHKVSTQFVAYAYSNGPDRKKGTADDMQLMPVKAKWSLAPYPEGNKGEDLAYIGKIDQSGLFTPGTEGTNAKRVFTAENVGSATVIAKYESGGKTLIGKTHLIVTVPDYNNIVN
ncbi:quinohemoprotein amine dehydrogenase subunit alpha [Aneurinibacillus thermoaerophilus]|uniref:quinohemoprotein amine dehydrogenase subunit alpha n=1 Tax=Aneurinibacillus thermoaerophilus TaxID=143495 RepID=UPI002E23A666|nr:quinohemoprotein amine dehydrogenase subunit alpha [Aneurinibacillus thermoaerophilus]